MRSELKDIRKIRDRNNDLWMEILNIALTHAPEETKSVLGGIRSNDMAISEFMEGIIDED